MSKNVRTRGAIPPQWKVINPLRKGLRLQRSLRQPERADRGLAKRAVYTLLFIVVGLNEPLLCFGTQCVDKEAAVSLTFHFTLLQSAATLAAPRLRAQVLGLHLLFICLLSTSVAKQHQEEKKPRQRGESSKSGFYLTSGKHCELRVAGR